MTEAYDESSIKVFQGLEGVRKRPSMYIGAIETGRFHILKEVLDNSVDEALAGCNKKVGCIITEDYYEVFDEGRGIPVGIHPDFKKEKKSTLEIIFTTLHAGGKLENNAYSQGSVGTHGCGASCTNALSTYFQVWTFRDKKWWTQEFSKGKPVSPVIESSPGKEYKKGTVIRFKPDAEILPNALNLRSLVDWFRNSAFLNGGIEFYLNIKGKEKTYKSKGLIDYIQYITKDLECEPLNKPFILKTANVDVALQWFESDDTNLNSWCNTSPTIEGGTHLQGLINVINKGFDSLVKKKGYKSEDLRMGLFGAINIKIAQPHFDSQTKEKLISAEATKLVMDQIYNEFEKYLNSNKTFVKKVTDRANSMRAIYNRFTQEKKALSKLKTRGKANLPPSAKFAASTGKDVETRELYIVEGDSAGGTAKMARDPHNQEVLKLRGKILNVAKATLAKAYESEDVLNILKGIGFDPTNKERHRRVGKVIILTDADTDGPLAAETRILTLNNENPTIKEFYERWQKDKKPLEVYSIGQDGRLRIGQAINPEIRDIATEYLELEFDNGSKIRCTKDHKFLVNFPDREDSKIIWNGKLGYKRAEDLTGSDSISSVYFENRRADGNLMEIPIKNYKLVSKKLINNTEEFYCVTVPGFGNFMIDDGFGNGICSSNCHISVLLLTLFQKIYPELLDEGRVFTVDAPLFIGKSKTKEYYGESLADLRNQYSGKFESVTRMKGWGEADFYLLKKVAFDPATRKLLKIVPSLNNDLKYFHKIVGEDTKVRKEILMDIKNSKKAGD